MANPVLTSLNPNSGPVGTSMQINGMNLVQGGLHGVVIFSNNVNATTVYSYTNTTIVVAVPSGIVTGPVFVEFPHVNSNSLTYTNTTPATPHINTLTPSSGGVGIQVVIAGTNFGATQGTSTVTFNGVPAMVVSWSATSITAIVPTTATTGPVVVTVAGVASNSVTFTVTAPSNGGTSTPLGFLVYPIQNFSTPSIYVFATRHYPKAQRYRSTTQGLRRPVRTNV